MLNENDRELISHSVLCWLSTASAEGKPNVSPKEIFALQDNQLLIANIASRGSARNVKQNHRACVAFLNIFRQKGVQVHGTAEVITKADERFAQLATPLFELAGDDFPFSSLFLITPESVKPIIAPRYRLFPETTESDQIASAMLTYNVRPAD
ncbi:MAG: pyridoxamine 5'-phosphate oxidase family protein [Phycisphaerales bacterium]